MARILRVELSAFKRLKKGELKTLGPPCSLAATVVAIGAENGREIVREDVTAIIQETKIVTAADETLHDRDRDRDHAQGRERGRLDAEIALVLTITDTDTNSWCGAALVLFAREAPRQTELVGLGGTLTSQQSRHLQNSRHH
eukprot:scaffold537_cov180-Ochromonas_danica.AAC.3